MLIELQTLLVNRSVLSKAQMLVDDLEQWDAVLSQSNPGNGKRIPNSWCTDLKTMALFMNNNIKVGEKLQGQSVDWSFLINKFNWVMVPKVIGIEYTQPQQQSLCYVFVKYSPSRKVSPSYGWQVGGFVIPLYPSKTIARDYLWCNLPCRLTDRLSW